MVARWDAAGLLVCRALGRKRRYEINASRVFSAVTHPQSSPCPLTGVIIPVYLTAVVTL